MRDLQSQIRDYFDEVGEPVTIEDVFFADVGDDRVRPLEPFRRPVGFRRPWLIAAGAALAAALLVGVPLLIRSSTPSSTLPPGIQPSTTIVTSTTEPSTTTTRQPTTTLELDPVFDPGPLPEFGAEVPLDPAVEAVVADLVALATELGIEPPLEVGAQVDSDTGRIEAYVNLNPDNDAETLIWVLPIDVYRSVEEAEAAFDAALVEESGGQEIDPIPLGDESFGVTWESGFLGSRTRFLVREGPTVVSIEARPAGDLRAAATTVIETLLEIRRNGTVPNVALAPFAMSAELPETYEVEWGILAAIANRPGVGDDPIYIDRRYSLGVTPEFTRCRFAGTPFGEVEPQDYTDWIDDGSGNVSLSRRFAENEEFVEENLQLPSNDPSYLAHRAECDRFTPLAGDWGLDELFAASVSEVDPNHINTTAYRTGENDWVLGVVEERSASLDLTHLVTAGVITTADPAGVEILDGEVSFDPGGRVQGLRFDASGSRSAIEEAFDVDLSEIPADSINLSFEFEFRLELNGPGNW